MKNEKSKKSKSKNISIPLGMTNWQSKHLSCKNSKETLLSAFCSVSYSFEMFVSSSFMILPAADFQQHVCYNDEKGYKNY